MLGWWLYTTKEQYNYDKQPPRKNSWMAYPHKKLTWVVVKINPILNQIKIQKYNIGWHTPRKDRLGWQKNKTKNIKTNPYWKDLKYEISPYTNILCIIGHMGWGMLGWVVGWLCWLVEGSQRCTRICLSRRYCVYRLKK